MNNQSVTLLTKRAMGAPQRLGGWPLQESARFAIDRATQEIIRRGITDVEFDRRIELDQLNQIGLAKDAFFVRRLSGACAGWRLLTPGQRRGGNHQQDDERRNGFLA